MYNTWSKQVKLWLIVSVYFVRWRVMYSLIQCVNKRRVDERATKFNSETYTLWVPTRKYGRRHNQKETLVVIVVKGTTITLVVVVVVVPITSIYMTEPKTLWVPTGKYRRRHNQKATLVVIIVKGTTITIVVVVVLPRPAYKRKQIR